VSLDESLADGQSKACTARMLLAAMSRPVETPEHMFQLVGGDTRPIVRNCYNKHIVPPLGGNTHFALTIHERVGDQIVEHNLHSRAVHVYQGQIAGDVQS
jgi:hypothetical protein